MYVETKQKVRRGEKLVPRDTGECTCLYLSKVLKAHALFVEIGRIAKLENFSHARQKGRPSSDNVRTLGRHGLYMPFFIRLRLFLGRRHQPRFSLQRSDGPD